MKLPLKHGVTGAPPVKPVMVVLLQNDQTHEAKSGPHGQLELG